MNFPFPGGFPAELRFIESSDAETLFTLVDSNREYLRKWLPWLDGNMTVADTMGFIRSAREQYLHNRGFQTGIWFEGKLAGIIGYHPIDWQNRIAMLGYWLGESYQGKGIVTRASQLLVDYAFDEYGLNRVEIRCAVGNTKSRAIPLRLKFTEERIIADGEWLYNHFVDLVVYRMLARERAVAGW